MQPDNFTAKAKLIAAVFLKKVEALRLTPYLDSAGVPTDGYGNTHNVRMGFDITEQVADSDLINNIQRACFAGSQIINFSALTALNDDQQAAIISFIFNVGCNPTWNFWKLLNSKQFDKVPAAMAQFNHVRDPKTKKLVENKGLTNRRALEIKLWMTNIATIKQVPDHVEIAPNTLVVQKQPNPQVAQNVQIGHGIVGSGGLLGVIALVGKRLDTNPVLAAAIIGFVLGYLLIFILAVVLYIIERHKNPISDKDYSDLDSRHVKGYDGMNDQIKAAVDQLIATANARKTSAVAEVQGKLDAANQTIEQLQTSVNQLQQQVTDLQNAATTASGNAGGQADADTLAAIQQAGSELQ